MEKIFGGLDYVEAGEHEESSEKREAQALVAQGDKAPPTTHVENVNETSSSQGPERSPV